MPTQSLMSLLSTGHAHSNMLDVMLKAQNTGLSGIY